MKIIDLKTSKEKVVIGGKSHELDITTVELLKTALNSPVQGGYTASDMLTRIKLLDKVEEAEKTTATSIELEDAQFLALGKIVSNTKWSVISRFIAEFVESFDKK